MKKPGINRRKFIRNASLGTVAAGMVPKTLLAKENNTHKTQDQPKIVNYRDFGKTGFKVSDLSSGAPGNEAVLKALIESGVNLIDGGEVYGNGNSERIIGKVLQDYDRTKFFINSKLYTETEYPSKKEVIERTEAVLGRIQSDYVDCMMIHSAEHSGIITDAAFHAGMEQMKKEGKVRHVGVSCHGNNWAYPTKENLEKILMTAINDGRFDVILLAYNFVNADLAEKILEACDKKGIATMIMKSNPIYLYHYFAEQISELNKEGKEADEGTRAYYDNYKRMNEQAQSFFSKYGIADESEFSNAASRFVLTNPKAHTTLWNFQNFDDVNSIISLSGQKLTGRDQGLLSDWTRELGHTACRIGCNDCESACPKNIPVNRILRYNYYFGVKRQEKRAITKYAKLNLKDSSSECISCEGHCEKACPHGVWAKTLVASARQNMEISVG